MASSSTLIIYSILLFLLVTVLVLVIYDFIIAKINGTKKGKGRAKCAPRACNFSLRFAYEFLLEACLSMLIFAATKGDYYNPLHWLLAILTFVAIGALVVFLVSRF